MPRPERSDDHAEGCLSRSHEVAGQRQRGHPGVQGRCQPRQRPTGSGRRAPEERLRAGRPGQRRYLGQERQHSPWGVAGCSGRQGWRPLRRWHHRGRPEDGTVHAGIPAQGPGHRQLPAPARHPRTEPRPHGPAGPRDREAPRHRLRRAGHAIMSGYVKIHPDGSAVVPDGDVNRHVSVNLEFDPDTGAVRAVPDIDGARVRAGLEPITPGESPSVYGIPGLAAEQLHPQDTLAVSVAGGAAETDIVILHNYYTDLPGAAARLHSWGDIAGNIAHVKPIRVAVTTSATIGAWADTVITTTENLLKANTDYAVLGYSTNTALGAIGIKGPDTSNLRATGPGATSEFATSNYFAYLSQSPCLPFIPVFNAANANATFVSSCAATASVAAVVELIVAQLSSNLPT